jgi:hypothetical protein
MKRESIAKMSIRLLLLMVAVCCLVLYSMPLRADDQDIDGSDCLVEVYGYCAADAGGTYFPAANDLGAFFPNPCGLCTDCAPLTDPVDEYKPDLFVILGAETRDGYPPSLLRSVENDPKYWLKAIEKAKKLNLNVRAHRVNRDPFAGDINNISRAIVATGPETNRVTVQSAVRIYENTLKDLSSGAELGITPQQGTPNTLNDITLYTRRIEQFVTNTCAGKTCVYTNPETGTKWTLLSGADLTGLKDVYKKQVIAHETGHTMWLTAVPNTKAGGYHYPTGTGTIMDQSVRFTTKGTTVTWYFPAAYASADQPKLQ